MFNRLKRLIKPRRRLRPAIDQTGVRGRVERLEDRAMLSANIGQSMHGGGMYDFGPQDFGFQRNELGAFAKSVQTSSEYGSWWRIDREVAAASFRNFDGPRNGWGQDRVDPVRQTSSWMRTSGMYDLQSNRWNQFGSAYAWQQPTLVVIRVVQTTSTPPTGGFNSGNTKNPTTSGGSFAGLPPVFDPSEFLSSGGADNGKLLGLARGDATRGSEPNIGSFPLSTSAANIPTAAQILSRPADSIAFLKSGAVDSAFQSYAAQLLLLTTSANVADQLTSLTCDDALYADNDAGEYVTLANDPLFDDEVNAIDIVESERQAVDAVLSELHDFTLSTEQWNNLPATDRTTDAIGMIELNVNEVWLAALVDAEGGMVMLTNTGDANESAFELASGAESGGSLLHVHAGVEAAVGLYQTMDVGTDEAPVVNLPSKRSAVEPSRDLPGENRYSDERENSSSNKAAATVGATFVGALLWGNRKARKDQRDEKLA